MSGRKLFGTDGIRGKANTYPMTGEVAFVLGRAVTSYFQQNFSKKPLIIIGKDTRLSCYMLEQAFSAGVCSQGGKAILTGPLPTPGVAFVTQSMRADAGVMISASHNSFEDNGIKIFDRTGHKLPDEIELELERMVLDPSLISVRSGDQLGNAKRLDEVIGRYIVHTKAALSPQYSLEGLRIVVDGANGAGYKLAPIVFEELGAEVIPMGNTPNGININKNCGALHPQLCADAVIKYRADLGVCLDGDGDRLTIVDGNGDVIHGDKLIGLCGKFLKDNNEIGPTNEVVGTVMSNFGLEYYLQQQGLTFTRTQVGDRYIVE
jgi:phosphoglucosamine mutase